jgi:hypothetical protein
MSKFCFAIVVVAAAIGAVTGEGWTGRRLPKDYLRGDGLADKLNTRNTLRLTVFATRNCLELLDRNCLELLDKCMINDECAGESDGLTQGLQPVSGAAQALVQCVRSNKGR